MWLYTRRLFLLILINVMISQWVELIPHNKFNLWWYLYIVFCWYLFGKNHFILKSWIIVVLCRYSKYWRYISSYDLLQVLYGKTIWSMRTCIFFWNILYMKNKHFKILTLNFRHVLMYLGFNLRSWLDTWRYTFKHFLWSNVASFFCLQIIIC